MPIEYLQIVSVPVGNQDQAKDFYVRGLGWDLLSDEEYEQTRKSLATRVSHMLDTKRAGDLFELPDPKRRITGARAAERGPIAPAPPQPPHSPSPSPRTPATDMPPGYDDEGKPGRGSA